MWSTFLLEIFLYSLALSWWAGLLFALVPFFLWFGSWAPLCIRPVYSLGTLVPSFMIYSTLIIHQKKYLCSSNTTNNPLCGNNLGNKEELRQIILKQEVILND